LGEESRELVVAKKRTAETTGKGEKNKKLEKEKPGRALGEMDGSKSTA